MSKLKIFVSAYACEPGLGSEIGVGWHWVLEMSKYFELWVMTRESNRHTIEPWIKGHPEYSGIHFLYYDWPKWARFWKKGLRGVRTYYNLWQLCTNRIVKRTMQVNDIRIFHHLTYGNVLWKVSSYGQKQFFIWGPVGGVETIPAEYSAYYDRKSKWIEALRRMVVKWLPLNAGFQARCRRADLILCKTDVTRQAIPAPYHQKAVLFTDVAVKERKEDESEQKSNPTHDAVHFLSVGRLDAWRGFDLIIEAMVKVVIENPAVHLTIVGDGADKERLLRLTEKYALQDVVTLLGKVSMDVYKKLMEQADVIVNAALKEGAVTVSFDSMALGKPLICLDTTGYTRYFKQDYAVLIPITSREKVIEQIKDGMLYLTSSSVRKMMGQKAHETSFSFSWERHGEKIRNLIKDAYESEYS